MDEQGELFGDDDFDRVPQTYDEAVPIEDLAPHPRNPNIGDLDSIRGSIRSHGFYGAVVAQISTGYIVAGEHRWRAAIAEGYPSVPVIWKDIDDETALRLVLVDNETARRSRNDEAKLEEALRELTVLDPDLALTGTGFTLRDLERIEQARELIEPTEREFADQYAIIVECDNEAHQQEVFEWLTQAGYRNLRVVTV